MILDSGLDDRDAGILETPSGTLLATTFTSLAYQPILERARKEGRWDRSRLRRWEAAHARLDAASRQSQLGQWILRSEDGGLNWSAKTPSVVNSPHGPIALSNGRLLYAGKELWTGQRRIGVAFSGDDGRSWQWAAEIPAREGDDPAEYHELHAVEMPDRRVVVHIRNHNPSHAGETLQCESTDGGLSWTKPRSVGVWGLPSHLLRLADGRALMTYGHRRPLSATRPGSVKMGDPGRHRSVFPPMGPPEIWATPARAADRWFAGQCVVRTAGESSQGGAAPGSVVAGGLITVKGRHGLGVGGVPSLCEILFALHGDFAKDSPCLDLPTSGMHGRLLKER